MCGASLESAWAYGRMARVEWPRNVEFQTPSRPIMTGRLSANGAVRKCSSMSCAPASGCSDMSDAGWLNCRCETSRPPIWI